MVRLLLLSCAAMALTAAAVPAQARPWITPPPILGPQFNDRAGDTRREVRPLHELVPEVRRQVGGDFVGLVRLEEGGARSIYVIRWRFDNGEVSDVRVDAQSGQVLDR